jgi:protein involved in polysaccharide export with SLBB domain
MMRKLLVGMCLLPFLCAVSVRPARAEYRLGPDDNLAIRVYEWPDLTGDFRVGPDGKISFPLIGDVSAKGLSRIELEQAIAQGVMKDAGLKEAPSVAVQIKEYRPFFIIGDVQKPGEYPFHPGLTVLQAVSVAGGYFRFSDPGLLRLERDAIMQRGALQILQDKLLELTARSARLKAESEAATDITFPTNKVFDQTNPKIASLMERERSLFQRRRSDLDKQLAQADDLQKLFGGEIQALQAQMASEKTQAGLVKQELDQLQTLAARGLASNPRMFLVERAMAEIEGTERNLDAQIMRSRQNIVQAAQKADELKSTFRERVDTESGKVASEIQSTQAQIDTAKQLVAEAEDTAPVAIARRLHNTGMEPKFTLSRRNSAGQVVEEQVVSSDEIEPGDVVSVDAALDGTTELSSETPKSERRTELLDSH